MSTNSSNVHTPRNYVKAKIGSQAVPYRCLVDSGADRNVIRRDTAQKLRIKIDPIDRTGRRLLAANSSAIEIAGTATVPVQLNDFYTESEFLVVNQLQHPIILGTTFLQENNACVDFVESSLIIGKGRTVVPMIERVAEGEIVRVMSDVRIPPMHEGVVCVNVAPSLIDGVYMIEPLTDAYRAGVQHGTLVARACVNVCNHSTICRVLNITDQTILLKKNRAIAYVSAIYESDLDSIDSDQTDNEMNDVYDESQVEHESEKSHDEKLKELSKYGFKLERDDLTEKQFEELVSLIYEYRIVFDEKIVGVKDFEYHIDFKPGQSPRRVKQYYHNPLVRKEIDKQLAEWERDGLIEKGPYK
jgi:gag-polyprotein putative aspartyl protease